MSALLREDAPRAPAKSPVNSNLTFDAFRATTAANYPPIYEQNMLHHRPLFHTFPWLAAVAFHQGQQPNAPSGAGAGYGPIAHEDLLRFRSLVSQTSTSSAAALQGPNAAAAHLNFAQQHHLHHHHHHLFMRPGIPSLGDVYSCVKCEKMFSTPHGKKQKPKMKKDFYSQTMFFFSCSVPFQVWKCIRADRTTANDHLLANYVIKRLVTKSV